MNVLWQWYLQLGGLAANVLHTEPKCYDELGCFSTGYPWLMPLTPFPAPQNPHKVNTTFYFHNRNNSNWTYMRTWPTINLAPQFDKHKPTYFVTHGYFSDSNVPWFKNLTESILSKSDGNMFTVDWASGSTTYYCQAASNARIVGAEVQRVIQHLISEADADPSTFHLFGHSLGAHVMSYAAKNVTGIGRITALDPAQPGFQGRHPAVRLHENDAKFIDVVHTDARPFVPFLGFGMSERVGHVDFFVNGGQYQPNCILDGDNFMYKSFSDIPKITMDGESSSVCTNEDRASSWCPAVPTNDCCPFAGRKFALELVIDIGMEKMSRDYTYLLLRANLAELYDMRQQLSKVSTGEFSTKKYRMKPMTMARIHLCLEFSLIVQDNLNCSLDTSHSFFDYALKLYTLDESPMKSFADLLDNTIYTLKAPGSYATLKEISRASPTSWRGMLSSRQRSSKFTTTPDRQANCNWSNICDTRSACRKYCPNYDRFLSTYLERFRSIRNNAL